MLLPDSSPEPGAYHSSPCPIHCSNHLVGLPDVSPWSNLAYHTQPHSPTPARTHGYSVRKLLSPMCPQIMVKEPHSPTAAAAWSRRPLARRRSRQWSARPVPSAAQGRSPVPWSNQAITAERGGRTDCSPPPTCLHACVGTGERVGSHEWEPTSRKGSVCKYRSFTPCKFDPSIDNRFRSRIFSCH